LSVEDTGCGIAPDHLERVFEPYWRGEGERRGLGLGLCIAKGLVEAHGARIEIESAVGRGTRVEIIVAR
jgi:signal transduction histidine kinase